LPWGLGVIAGVGLGLLSLVASLLLLGLAFSKRTTPAVITTVVSQLLGLPALWLGTPFATDRFLLSLDLDDEIRLAYATSLALSFFVPSRR
jgi:hypothetical protein